MSVPVGILKYFTMFFNLSDFCIAMIREEECQQLVADYYIQ